MSKRKISKKDINSFKRFCRKHPVAAAVIMLVVIGICLYSYLGGNQPAAPMKDMYVHYIDIGQGDAELICCNGQYMLIDGGEVNMQAALLRYLRQEGVKELQYVICTHAHSDHCGGLDAVLKNFDVKTLFTTPYAGDSGAYEHFLRTADSCGIEPEVPDFSAGYKLGDAEFRFIGPIIEHEDQNANSLVVRLSYGESSFLFTGDMTSEAEQELLDAGVDVSCDVLKVAHHASFRSTSYSFLYEAEPDIAVISCGKNNDYGHPHKEVLSRLRDADCTVYRTDEEGSIVLFCDGSNVKRIQK